MARSVLDDLGEEITGIVAPVSICMALVVVLVKALNPEGMTDSSSVAIATIAYHEKDTDSAGEKLGGALLNAVVFVAVIGGMTFVLFLLFKWGCYRLIYGYMAFAMANVFFFLTGALLVQLLRLAGLHMDLVSLTFLLLNFSVLGILSLFFLPVPLLLKQAYTVWVGICVAFIFTHVPEWTTWVLLVAMALYDLAAVLLPGGPLKILVELAIERQQELPALVYEARPVGRPYQRGMWGRRQQQQPQQQQQQDAAAAAGPEAGGGAALPAGAGAAAAARHSAFGSGAGDASPSHRVALLAGHRGSSEDMLHEMSLSPGGNTPVTTPPGTVPTAAAAGARAPGAAGSGSSSSRRGPSGAGGPLGEGREGGQQQQQGEAAGACCSSGALGQGPRPLAEAREGGSTPPGASTSSGGAGPLSSPRPALPGGAAAAGAQEPPRVAAVGDGGQQQAARIVVEEGEDLEGSEGSSHGLPDAIKLGLGDFIFYSMLVGRAAMYDMTTVFASYLAIIAGLVITLLLLALARKALPALPVSIALGVLFYFLTRLVLEPVVVPLVLGLGFY